MTLEIQETKSNKGMSSQEILDCFKGIGQTEIPTRDMVVKSKKAQKEPKKRHIKRMIVPYQRKKPSQSYLCNLNPRIDKAQAIWSNTWAHERGDLLRSVGVKDNQMIVDLANDVNVPECIVNHYISK